MDGSDRELSMELRSVSGTLLEARSGAPGRRGWVFDGSRLPSLLVVRLRSGGSAWVSRKFANPVAGH
ncbi:MAG TPA: hypothetical protein PKO15_04315 [Fibrobacteria bacterium]|nr:hypothetical protein [Fibrobacteria bacterium]HOX51620.1 hypothetical protein [Fibrobacteria bacterium]